MKILCCEAAPMHRNGLSILQIMMIIMMIMGIMMILRIMMIMRIMMMMMIMMMCEDGDDVDNAKVTGTDANN